MHDIVRLDDTSLVDGHGHLEIGWTVHNEWVRCKDAEGGTDTWRKVEGEQVTLYLSSPARRERMRLTNMSPHAAYALLHWLEDNREKIESMV